MSILRDAERELEAVTTRAGLDRAAAKPIDAKVQLKRMKAPASPKDAPRPQGS